MATFELMPGDVALGRVGDTLRTLLGSCVSVILTDPRRTVGVMCHIVHVGRPNAANEHNTAYGSVAMSDMTRRLFAVGFAPRSCQAYVYGGGNMFPKLFTHHHVGANNAEWVLGYLAHHKIALVHQDLGGAGYRKLSWTVGAGEPKVETLPAV
ncbi:MAG: chemoreceptor glutamine deamidase CheD [Rhodoferax sp.]